MKNSTLLLCALASLGACGSAALDDELSAGSAAIINGTPYDGHPAVGRLCAYLNGAGTCCTGTLVAPQWVLTAAHCLDKKYAPANVSFKLQDGTVVNAAKLTTHPAFDQRLHGDIGIVQLARAVTHISPTTVALYTRNPGTVAPVIGYGQSVVGDPSTSGVKRIAYPTITMLSPVDGVSIPPVVYSGDSGGPLLTADGSQVTAVVSSATHVRTELYINWLAKYSGGAIVKPSTAHLPADYRFRSNLDGVNDHELRGWVCFQGQATSLNVHLYVGGSLGKGTWVKMVKADQPSEAGLSAVCQTNGHPHRFKVALTDLVPAHAGKAIWLHAGNQRGLVIPGSGNVKVPTTPCPAGQTKCGTACVDVQTNRNHCGACNRACPANATCQAGKCACTVGLRLCGGNCVDTQSSPQHCGQCDRACPADHVCSASQCVLTCSGGRVACGGACVDTASSTAHCGQCDNACAPIHALGQCQNGVCAIAQCDAGYVDLNKTVADGCEYACTARGEEVCNGADDDCDGEVDEALSCQPPDAGMPPLDAGAPTDGGVTDGGSSADATMRSDANAPSPSVDDASPDTGKLRSGGCAVANIPEANGPLSTLLLLLLWALLRSQITRQGLPPSAEPFATQGGLQQGRAGVQKLADPSWYRYEILYAETKSARQGHLLGAGRGHLLRHGHRIPPPWASRDTGGDARSGRALLARRGIASRAASDVPGRRHMRGGRGR